MPNDPPPDQKPDLQPPKSDWLHTVARATYGSVFGGDQAQLPAIYLASRRSLALAAAGDDAGSALTQTAAEAQARAALAANPDWPDAHFALGLVLAGAGQGEQAAVNSMLRLLAMPPFCNAAPPPWLCWNG